jgi:hypothetical protein
MRKKRPHVAGLDEVRIRREGDDAIIEFHDQAVAVTYMRIGHCVHRMSDRQILDEFNRVVADEQRAAAEYQHVAVEIPAGRPQIAYSDAAAQWVPRGGVLRCVIDDGGPDCEAILYIDEQALSLQEFGRLLCTYAGWGMRIVFVPEGDLGTTPRIEVCEPDEEVD